LARLGAVFRDVGVVARQILQQFGRHSPLALGRRLHDGADVALPLVQDVDKGLAVKAERHCTPKL